MSETKTRTANKLHALAMSAREEVKLTRTQERAIDLYKRGFNIFPLPHKSKEPFYHAPVKPLYNVRLHFCGDGVQPCRHNAPTFASLFTGLKNFAVMCGKTSGNLLAVDCDSHAAYTDMGQRLDALGVPYWAFTSHRGGAYLLRVKEGEAANVAKCPNFKDVQLWGHSHYVLVPTSLHPEGTYYAWRGGGEPFYNLASDSTLPAVSVSALEWLGVTLLKDSKPQAKPFEMFGLSAVYAVLSKRNRETLALGVNEGERNTRLTALAYDLAATFDREDIEADFLNAAALCEPSYKRRDSLAILKSAYAKERTRARQDSNTGGHSAQSQRLYAFVNSFDWKATFKRKARTRRAVFVACVERADIEGATFRASVRELAEIVNRKFQYVGVCLRELCDAGLLRLVETWHKSASGGNVYAFGDVVKHYCQKETVINTCNSNVSFWQYSKNTNTDEYKDVFGLKGLGAVAGEVLKALQVKKYQSVYAIAKDTGAGYNSVKRAVNKLVTHGLAIHSQAEGLYYAEAVNEADLLAVSVKLATNGRAELQRIRHGIDREIFVTRNLARAMAAYNDVTGEKREFVTLHRGQNGTKERNKKAAESVTKQAEKTVTKQPSKADQTREEDFTKILEAYRVKMGEEASGAMLGVLREWQKWQYELIAEWNAEEETPEDRRTFTAEDLFTHGTGRLFYRYKHGIGATLTNEAARFIWLEDRKLDGWIISETLREMSERRGEIRKPFAYMRKVVNDKRREWGEKCEAEEMLYEHLKQSGMDEEKAREEAYYATRKQR